MTRTLLLLSVTLSVAALAEAYPQDKATGYSEGDFRGFLWAEVKKTTAP